MMKFILFCILLSFPLIVHAQMGAKKKDTKKTEQKKEPWNRTPLLLKDIRPISVPTRSMDRECLARLKAAKIPYQLYDNVAHVRTPIRPLTDRLGGVVYRRAWNNPDAPWIFECKTVENLILAGPHLRKAGVASMYWTSAWRVSMVKGKNRLSRHAYGEALDVTAIDGGFGYAALVNHWEKCGRGGCKTPRGRALRGVVSALRGTGLFNTVLGPDHDRYHRDHFHIDSPARDKKLPVKVDLKIFEKEAKEGKIKTSKSADAPKKPPEKPAPGDPPRHHVIENPQRPWEPPRSRPPHY